MSDETKQVDDVQKSLDQQAARHIERLADHFADLAHRLRKRGPAQFYSAEGKPRHIALVADVLGDLRQWAGTAVMIEQLVTAARDAERNYMEEASLRHRLDRAQINLRGAEHEIDRLREQAGEMAEQIEALQAGRLGGI